MVDRGPALQKELPFSGVYRLAKDGRLTLLARDIKAPNGIAFSPSEKTLYVSNADPKRAVWLAHDVKRDGTLGKRRVFFDATPWARPKRGASDGMKVDTAGHLFAVGPGGVYVFSPDGTHLGSIEIGTLTSNVVWGDNGSVLYITADAALCRTRLSTVGAGF